MSIYRYKVSNVDDARQKILEELQKYGGKQKESGEWLKVICPFHRDSDPSCNIYLVTNNERRQLGSFHCWSCKEYGDWNKFAEKTNLLQFKNWALKGIGGNFINKDTDELLLGQNTYTLKKLLENMNCGEAQPWPSYMKWRGINGKLIEKLGGMIITDDYNNDIAVLFPVIVNKKYKGGVKAIYKKRFEKQIGYITSKTNGESWVKNSGLLFYDYTKRIIQRNKYDFVILVEGPRDAIRLLSVGIPAIAILGALSFSEIKLRLITMLKINYVYAMPDNDLGGNEMWAHIKPFFKNSYLELKRFKLPREYKNGELIPVDPFSASKEVIHDLMRILNKLHNWKKEKIT